jgi:hypothetical protein
MDKAVKEINRLRAALEVVLKGYEYGPGESDLDNEQPIRVSMTLGDYRRIRSLL